MSSQPPGSVGGRGAISAPAVLPGDGAARQRPNSNRSSEVISRTPVDCYNSAIPIHSRFYTSTPIIRTSREESSGSAQVERCPRHTAQMSGSAQDAGLPQETTRALSALNFVVNRRAAADLNLLTGWTADNALEKVREALTKGVGNFTEDQAKQYADALLPAVNKLAPAAATPAAAAAPAAAAPTAGVPAAAAPTAAAPAAGAASSAAPASPAQLVDVAGILQRAASASAPSPAAAPAPAASRGPSLAPAPKPAGGLGALPGAGAAGPSSGARQVNPGGLSMLPSRPGGAASSQPQPAATGASASRPAAVRPAGTVATATAAAAAAPAVMAEDPNEPPEIKALRKKVQDIRILLFRLAKRLDQNLRGSIVNQVEYRLSLAERIRLTNRGGAAVRRASPFEAACQEAERLEAENPGGDLKFKCTVMLLGMSGVGKSATINSLMGEGTVPINAFEAETRRVRVVSGMVHGVKMRFIDTPGLMPSAAMTGKNMRTLSQAKAAFKRYKPDIVLYLDRMDLVRRDFGDLPLLRSITDIFGASMWFNTIVVLTHGSSAPPEGPNGQISYDVYANHRSHILQQTIRQAAGDTRLLNPVTYAENHPNCRRNTDDQPVLPNGTMWKQNLLLYIFSSKVLADTESVLKIQSASSQMANMGAQKIPPIPYLLSNMIQSKKPRHAPDDEREIKSIAELEKLPEAEHKSELRKRKEYEKMRADEAKADAENKTQVAVPAPDPALQPTFDSDNNGHRYRFLEAAGGWIVRPFVEAHGVDHDDGVEGFSCERGTMIRPRNQYLGGIPFNTTLQLQKDKNQFSVNGEMEGSIYHTANVITTGAIEVQTIGGKDMVYTSRLESRIKNHPNNKTSMGLTLSRLANDNLPLKGPVATGIKAENRVKIKDGLKGILSAGMMSTKTRAGRETAKAANAEMRLKSLENPNKTVTVGGSLMHWRRDLLKGVNVSAQYPLTDETVATTRANLNSKGTGQLAIRVTSHDHPILGLSLLVPVVGTLFDKIFRGEMY